MSVKGRPGDKSVADPAKGGTTNGGTDSKNGSRRGSVDSKAKADGKKEGDAPSWQEFNDVWKMLNQYETSFKNLEKLHKEKI